jgi:hypothetical protein
MHTKINVTHLEIFTAENTGVINMTLDNPPPPGKTSLEYMSIYEENRWWNTTSTKYR